MVQNHHMVQGLLDLLSSATSTRSPKQTECVSLRNKVSLSHIYQFPAADKTLLAAFIGEHLGEIASVKGWLSGIRAWHVYHGAPWYGDDPLVKLARITAKKQGSHRKKQQRPPVSIEHLVVLKSKLDLDNPKHAATWAIATTTFFGCRRLGETTILSAKKFDPRYHVTKES